MTDSRDKDFKEKIGAFRIYNAENNKPLCVANSTDGFPIQIDIYAEIDFFNIKPDSNYFFQIAVKFNNDNHSEPTTIHQGDINVPKDLIGFETITGYGKVTANFKTHLLVKNSSDCYFHSILFKNREEELKLDERFDYFYFGNVGSDENE
ncbi:hypothetical protein [Streptococcus agalactiae]|uniref:hypothetical protein n=1 Tax=Streptococcus agalactiae TaxID=1311 RepID=UPI000B699401|nr:hypothetical protein [Streptococcus agalactiae]MBY4836505.1 hypothetical protein [Streptococcus agalactiae]MBY5054666.1 hypothetical protein [Streptococcus agalactiae]MCP9190913.1 hypothetical protein [Streptococcus agalactiae]OTG53651.1 hypothetical protein B7932_03070 [Streptococcus agalactiae]OTG59113.1 hypothetical protein B7930_02960 [Streptococcus agalactiae]